MGKKFEYKQHVKKISGGGTNVDIELKAVDEGYKRTLQSISCENETHGCTYIRIGYKTQFGEYHWWIEQKTPQAGVLYWTPDLKVIQAGDQLVIRFNGSTISDVLAAYVDGYTEKVK